MKKSTVYTLFLLWTILSGSALYAQTIKGIVSDKNGPIPQVNVIVKGTTTGTVTDIDGSFTISTVNSNAILVISYLGYLSQEVPVSGRTDLIITLKEDLNSLNEVIIVGYNSQKKASISSAVSMVDMESLSKTKVPDVAQALQGQIAGVFVAANTGAPGDGIKIRIRGEGTLGNNDVLYVVDGVSTRDISFLNQSDVKSMTVLKDAAAGAVYGSRAAGGVVVITTKSGQKGKSTISADYYSGLHFATNLPKMLNTDQYLTVKDQAWHNTIGNSSSAISPYVADRSRSDLANTNWQDELFTTGISKNFQASISGGSENLQYLISGGYFGMDGIVVENHDKYQRVNFRANINANVSDRFNVGTNLQISHAKQDKLSSSGDAPGIIRHALLRSPILGVYKDINDPTYSASNPYTDLPFYTGPDNGWSQNYEFTSNPIAIVHFTDDKRNTFQTFGNVYGEYAFLKDNSLKFKSNVGVDIQFTHNKNFAQNFGDANISDVNNTYYGLGRNNRPNVLDENRGQGMTFTFTNTLNYVKTINEKHSVNLLLGQESITSDAAAIGGSRQNFDNTSDSFRYLDYGGQGVLDADGNVIRAFPYSSGSASNWALLSYFASGTYGFNNKYFATATMRADASSRFGANNKWGYFPSVSGGWIVSKENFMSKIDWISNLKLRASWGQSGNQEIPNNAFETLVSTTGGIVNIIRYGNPDLKWETTTQTNFGLDLSILKNKLSLSTDYFEKNTTDILLSVNLPAVSVGVIESTIVNAGAVSNKGFELGLNFQDNDHAFKYNINANVATLTNRVNKLQTYVKNIIDDGTHTKTEVGQAISSYYGLVFDGIYQNDTEINTTLFSNSNNTQPGDIKFKDLNGDGQINADDRAIIGNPIPKMTYGFSFSGEYKNFDISFLLQGVEGVDRYNDLKQILNYDSRPFNSMVSVLDSWHGEGTSNTTPRVTFNNNGGGNVSSVFVEDASYLRLKNIEIGYTFDSKVIGVKNLRIYASSQNLFTITKYTGLDPESTSLIDKGTYPQSKAFILGLQVQL
ncbi:TonB-dependent receptor [Flavobacterium sp. GSP27]|uniref:TonB-dependent receptor n=1 Tax=Flavobacterium bomense TaxID=2497483 RepID=A0A432CEY4_9FLAO|nr:MULTISPECIES: TonB-dependent receptor [Flavobacterium]RTY87485.1 TonB-dependent receptor [Flavobacterium sp. GSN2]RTY84845.1 TonB-dependent receptor [Flavobacterium sp. ZB4P23]RTZ01426.1 TonB-dependent receptor [Flavobacterium bomense]RTZ06314.1 TonB-dependent receptor [Flavobacterium sp. GSP6]RTZ10566.1 TonB-dependent receptor [Flavobacterium sp. GSP27]